VAFKFILDENLRGLLWRAIQLHNRRVGHFLDVVRVGDPPDLPLGSDDPAILLWAEREDRILLSLDRNTMPGLLAQHLQAGHHSPEVFLVDVSAGVPAIVGFLVLADQAGRPDEFLDQVWYIP
jgi:hypothetical protein